MPDPKQTIPRVCTIIPAVSIMKNLRDMQISNSLVINIWDRCCNAKFDYASDMYKTFDKGKVALECYMFLEISKSNLWKR